MTAPAEPPAAPTRSDAVAQHENLARSAPAAHAAAAVATAPVVRPDIAAPTEPVQIFLGFRGRISRRTWWLYGVAALLGLGVLLTVLLRVAGADENTTTVLVTLLLLWPSLAVSVKRWHDRDRSGWWVLVGLIPIVGPLWLLVANGLLPGTPGPNRYGADPRAAAP
jgi:uncharacterized membrane protein YhaH (DUF805 family)